MSDEGEPNESETAAEEDKPKARRKPVYVCLPIEVTPVTFMDDDGFETTVFTIPKDAAVYSISRCDGGKGQTEAVRAVLIQHEIDPTNYTGVMMFRANPIEFEISRQLIVRI